MIPFTEAAVSSVKIPADYFARLVEDLIQLVNTQKGDYDLYALAIDSYIAHFKPDETLGQDSPEFVEMVNIARASSVRLNALTDYLDKGHLNKWLDPHGKVDIRHPVVVATAATTPVVFRGGKPEFQPIAFNFAADSMAKNLGFT